MMFQLYMIIFAMCLTCCAGGTDVGNGVKTTDIDEKEISAPAREHAGQDPFHDALIVAFGEICTNFFKEISDSGNSWIYNNKIVEFERPQTTHKILVDGVVIFQKDTLPSSQYCDQNTSLYDEDKSILEIKKTNDSVTVNLSKAMIFSDFIEIRTSNDDIFLLQLNN